jgi:hypothetical protein
MGVSFLVAGLIARGELDEASAEYAQRAWEEDLPLAWPFTVLLFFRGRLHAARGDHEPAVAELLHTGELCEAWGVLNPAFVPWRSCAAASLTALGEAARRSGSPARSSRSPSAGAATVRWGWRSAP